MARIRYTALHGIGGGAPLNGTQGTVGEVHHRGGGVLHFDIPVPQGGGHAHHPSHRPHEPLQQIDGVYRLIHQRAATGPAPVAACRARA